MRRDIVLLEQMIEAADQALALVEGVSPQDLMADRTRRDALLWNFTVLGEASAQLSAAVKEQFADVAWRQPARLRNRIVHGYWSRSGHRPYHRARAAACMRKPQARAHRCFRGGRLKACC